MRVATARAVWSSDARVKVARWWDMTVNGSFFGYKFVSRYEGCEDASNTSYALGLINQFTLGPATEYSSMPMPSALRY